MTQIATRARHRKTARAITPLTNIRVDTTKGIALMSVTGVAVTATLTGAAAATAAGDEAESAGVTTTADTAANVQTVTTPDVAWTSTDSIEAVAEAPAPEPAPAEAAAEDTSADEAASRSETREDLSASSSYAQTIVDTALSFQGIPYVFGGMSLSGMDCSGLTSLAYQAVGVSLPRTAAEQMYAGTTVSAAEAQPGDILAWGSHVAIYLGDGMMVHAPEPGSVVTVAAVYGDPVYVRV